MARFLFYVLALAAITMSVLSAPSKGKATPTNEVCPTDPIFPKTPGFIQKSCKVVWGTCYSK